MEKNNELFELMTKMYSEMQDMKKNMITKEDLSKLENKVDTGFQELTTRIDDISNGIGSVIGIDVGETLSDKIDTIKDDLDFIKYKLNVTEEDVYKIKNRLRIIK